ncbi:hypothetical protein HQ590_01980 [bacterium]|nr:hypothetical protein [bacterium]
MKPLTRLLGFGAGLFLLAALLPPAARADSYNFGFGYSSGRHRGYHGRSQYGHQRHDPRHGGSYWTGSFSYSYAPRVYYLPAPRPRPPVVYQNRAPVYYYSGGSFSCY